MAKQQATSPAQKRQLWQQRLAAAKRACETQRRRMDERDAYYHGSRRIPAAGAASGGAASPARATNVRNIVYELIESQVDSALPQPKVTAIHPEDKPLAEMAEAMLRAQLRRLHFAELNDRQERTVPIQGGDYWHIEWDPAAGGHCTMGDLLITERHPRQVIPQPGVHEVDQMDYLFVEVRQSRQALGRRYGVLPETLEGPGENEGRQTTRPDTRAGEPDAKPDDELLTQNIAYYRNEQGGIGVFSWVGDTTLEDLPDYQARQIEVCAKCGRRRPSDARRCPVCGGKSFHLESQSEEELPGNVAIFGGEVLPGLVYGPDVPLTGPDGRPMLDEITGAPVMAPGEARPGRVPCYRPRAYPLVLRRNISAAGRLLGVSDVDMIADQQDAINKYGTKIGEKLLKGGSYVTLPQGVGVETTDRELKIIRLKTPADKAMIDVLNIQPDTSRDQQLLETNYNWAKSTLGITDAYQGKFDNTAISGVAKQFAANQAAGRLLSKREMKNAAYARLYQRMFQFMLAWADDPVPLTWQQPDGGQAFAHFDRYAFLKRDAAGELYWEDEFLFEVDPASNLASNREALWKLAEDKYRAGAFGQPAEPASQYRLWSLLAQDGYPHAEAVRQSLAAGLAQGQSAAQQNAAGMAPAAGITPGAAIPPPERGDAL